MLNATVRARGALRRLRTDRTTTPSLARTLRDRAVALASAIVVRPSAARASQRSGAHRASRLDHLTDRLGATLGARTSAASVRLGGRDRLLPVGVALLVLVGSLSSVAAAAPTGAVGGTQGSGPGLRLAIAGLAGETQGVDGGIGVDGPPSTLPGGTLRSRRRRPGGQRMSLVLWRTGRCSPIAVNTIVADGADTSSVPRPPGDT